MTTFISYSRNNSDFALRLARDLRAAGFDIWLDQLDIHTGARWDDEVEKALEKSSTFLIVLTPESIQSQNVKDEIGYAIDAGKHILPIILKPSNVPFRLRRFQYVDFSKKPYEESLVEIKHLLSNTKELARANDNGEDDVPIETPVLPLPTETATHSRRWNLLLLAGGIGAIVIALVIILPSMFRKQSVSQILTPVSVPPSETSIPELPTETLEASPTATITITEAPTSLPAEITDSKGVEMVLVPEGEFSMGIEDGNADEGPPHTISLRSFYMDKYEVTNALYKACLDAAICQPLKNDSSATRSTYFGNPEYDDYPVVYVDWSMAKTYCEWRGGRLPSEAEWEKAARGANHYLYPWGNVINCNYANYSSCTGDTSEVGIYDIGKSTYGMYDMVGNVWEWVGDWYSPDYYQISPPNDPTGSGNGKQKVLRSGSWSNNPTEVRSVNRFSEPPSDFNYFVGFRCAMDVSP